MLAILNYESAYGYLPNYANFDANDKPLLSWRIHILPFIGEQELYDKFRLDEPWDSPHNKALISQMPVVYLDPSSPLPLEQGRTHYLGVSGKGTLFDRGENKLGLHQITDGLSNTIAILQVNDARAVTWTKPEDWEFNAKSPMAGLKPNLHPGIFLAGFADGHVSVISEDVDPGVFGKLLTRNGGEVVNGF